MEKLLPVLLQRLLIKSESCDMQPDGIKMYWFPLNLRQECKIGALPDLKSGSNKTRILDPH